MAKEKVVTANDAVKLLNDILEKDPEAAQALIDARVPCNEAIESHPTVMVHGYDEEMAVGILGFLNGLFHTGDNDFKAIAACYDEDGKKLTKFIRL
jgi:hypothetical protein